MIWAAFMMGLVGSLHCAGMCGPLTLLLPQNQVTSFRYISGRTLYNASRIFTYAILGFLIGLFGEQSSLFISQNILSVLFGILILLVLFLPDSIVNKLDTYPPIARFTGKLKSGIKNSFGLGYFSSQVVFGLLNGLLPCGLVYAALAGAFLELSPWKGALFMGLFGLGTLPMMLSISLGSKSLRLFIGNHGRLFIKLSYSFLAVWLILRGFLFDGAHLHAHNMEGFIQYCVGILH